MQAILFLSHVVSRFRTPIKRARKALKSDQHRQFYEHGIMTHEIDALESTSHSKDIQPVPKQQ